MENFFNPKVTIGIPTYNRADGYFRQALESALNQTYQNIEIIIADNCSTDNTDSYVNSISDSRIKYFKHSKNIPPNDNFNFCLDKATGKYFLLLHDDDLIDHDFVEICMKEAASTKPFGVIRTGARVIDGNGNVLGKGYNNTKGLSTADFILSWFQWKTAFYFCCILYDTKLLREIGGIKSKNNLFQDVATAVSLATTYGRIDIHDVKANFRKHGSERTLATKVDLWVEDSFYLLDLICDLLPKHEHRLRKEGLNYFCKFNYELAKKIKSPGMRYLTYTKLLKTFRIVFLNQFLSQLLHRTPIYPETNPSSI